MTDFSSFVLLGFVIILLINITAVFNTGGLSKHNIHLFILGASSYYIMLAPIVTGFSENWVLYTLGWDGSVDIKDIYNFGMLMILVHFVFYTIGYFSTFRIQHSNMNDQSIISERLLVKSFIESKIFYLFLFLYLVIFLNTLAGGINLISIFMGLYGEATLGLQGYTYYLQNFADSLILVLIAGFYFKIKPSYFWLMMAAAIPLFLILGFRYRIILLVFGICIIYLRDNKISIGNAIKALLFVVVFLYSLLMLTENRRVIYMQDWEQLSFDVTELPYEALVNQAKGSRIDFAVYKAISEGRITHDLGETTFIYPFIKFLPSFVFSEGEKPYPPPQLRDLHIALNSGSQVGEAVTSIGSSFYAFGITGIIFFSLLLGFTVGKLQNRYGKTMFSSLFSIAIALALFMWITRGYTPGFLDHLGFMLIPVFILQFLYRKRINHQDSS